MNKKKETMLNLFEGKEIRSIWDAEKEDYYFSIVDVIGVLTESSDPSHYWRTLKSRMIKEGNETVTNCDTFKLEAKDGKMRNTDMLDTEGIFRLIESIPSKKAEPFKLWLAKLGREKIDEVFDPSKGIDQMIDFYQKKGYSLEWIEARIKAIIERKRLTNVWKDNGISEGVEYAILTNDIYKEWSGMTASEYKTFKGIRKENLRDNMTDLEITITNIGELATREIAKNEKPLGLNENRKVARRGGGVAKKTKDFFEEETGSKVLSQSNLLNYQYSDDIKYIEK
ncbi:MAG: Bro-N domain-containing protein [Bacilli bacterium]|nr:Bro-N domain-containing protein [Bacilli bacterium]